MDYSAYTASELAMDEHFQRWVSNPDDTTIQSFWKAWLEAHPEKNDTVREARLLLEQIQFTTYTLPQAESRRILEHIFSANEATGQSSRSHSYWHAYRSAAAVISLLIVSVASWFIVQTYFTNKVYKTAYGEKQTIVLPDNSKVVLNANSSLEFSHDWKSKAEREVWLKGEGYFSVVHTEHHQKFIVHTSDGLSVEVLGTEFNVTQRENATKVVLSSGRVKLSLPPAVSTQSILMQPGELVEYTQNHYDKRIVDPAMYTAWTSGKLILNHTSLKEISQMLQDNYGLQIQVSHPGLLQQTVSGSMPLGDVDALLAQIGKTFRISVTRDGQKVRISEYPN